MRQHVQIQGPDIEAELVKALTGRLVPRLTAPGGVRAALLSVQRNLMYLKISRRWPRRLGPCSYVRPDAWPSPNYCGHFGCEQADTRPFSCGFLFFCPLVFQINRSLKLCKHLKASLGLEISLQMNSFSSTMGTKFRGNVVLLTLNMGSTPALPLLYLPLMRLSKDR